MSNAQTWTLIGGFLAITVAMNTLLLRIVRLEVSSLRNEMVARFDAVNQRLDTLDRDVQRLFTHVYETGGET